MRLMDHHENTQMAKRDNSTHSSPVPTPSPPPHILRPNTTLRLTTLFDDVRTGKVAAYDPNTSLVTLRKTEDDHRSGVKNTGFYLDMKGSKPGLSTVAVVNLAHCREYTVVQEANDEGLEPLYPIDINKVKLLAMKTRKERLILVEKTSNGK